MLPSLPTAPPTGGEPARPIPAAPGRRPWRRALVALGAAGAGIALPSAVLALPQVGGQAGDGGSTTAPAPPTAATAPGGTAGPALGLCLCSGGQVALVDPTPPDPAALADWRACMADHGVADPGPVVVSGPAEAVPPPKDAPAGKAGATASFVAGPGGLLVVGNGDQPPTDLPKGFAGGTIPAPPAMDDATRAAFEECAAKLPAPQMLPAETIAAGAGCPVAPMPGAGAEAGPAVPAVPAPPPTTATTAAPPATATPPTTAANAA